MGLHALLEFRHPPGALERIPCCKGGLLYCYGIFSVNLRVFHRRVTVPGPDSEQCSEDLPGHGILPPTPPGPLICGWEPELHHLELRLQTQAGPGSVTSSGSVGVGFRNSRLSIKSALRPSALHCPCPWKLGSGSAYDVLLPCTPVTKLYRGSLSPAAEGPLLLSLEDERLCHQLSRLLDANCPPACPPPGPAAWLPKLFSILSRAPPVLPLQTLCMPPFRLGLLAPPVTAPLDMLSACSWHRCCPPPATESPSKTSALLPPPRPSACSLPACTSCAGV